MKPSHYSAPRTLQDATFGYWGEAIEAPERPARVPAWIWFVIGALLLLWTAFAITAV